jgi:two-component system response regulator FitH
MLEATGQYEVMTEDSGRRAVAAAPTFKPDLAVLDIMMPGMDGGEVASALRSHPATRAVQILFLTSLVGKGEQTSSRRRLTRDVYLAKPVDPQELCCRVAELLNSDAGPKSVQPT